MLTVFIQYWFNRLCMILEIKYVIYPIFPGSQCKATERGRQFHAAVRWYWKQKQTWRQCYSRRFIGCMQSWSCWTRSSSLQVRYICNLFLYRIITQINIITKISYYWIYFEDILFRGLEKLFLSNLFYIPLWYLIELSI